MSLQLIGIAIGLVPLTAYSQTAPLYRTIQSVTFALTATWESPALVPKDGSGTVIKGGGLAWENQYSVVSPTKLVKTYEFGSKMLSQKISNKEILIELVDEGVIDSIVGYSISQITSKFEDNRDDMISFYLTKKGMTPVEISDYLFVADDSTKVTTFSMKVVQTLTKDTATEVPSGKGSGKSLADITLELPSSGMFLSMRGVHSGSDTLKLFGKGSDQGYAWIPGSGKFSNVAGSISYSENAADESPRPRTLLEGSVSIGAGSLLLPVVQ